MLHYRHDLRVQALRHYGGCAGSTHREADSLQLDYGMFGTPITLFEASAPWRGDAWTLKALVVNASIPDAERINRAYANNTPERITGAYAEVAFDLLSLRGKGADRDLTAFARYETIDMEATLPQASPTAWTSNSISWQGGRTSPHLLR